MDCPLRFVRPEAWEMIDAADAAAKGLPPVAGGMLDQAAAFVAAWRFVRAETAIAEARREREALRIT